MSSEQQKNIPQIAVFGCGGWGKNIVRTMHKLGYLAAVIDPSESGRATAAALAPEVPVHADAPDVLASSEIDAVMIATPAKTHFTIAKEAILSGKDVYVEKPMTIDIKEAQALVDLADSEDRVLMVGHLLEYHPAICKIEEMILAGELGNLQYIVSNRLNLGKLRTEENVLWSFAPHDISVILRFMGATPTEVVATGGTFLTPGIADTTLTQLAFENGSRAHIFVSWLHPFKEQKLVVVGDKKMVTFCDMTKELVLHNQSVDWQDNKPVPVKGCGESIEFSQEMPLDIECQHFADCVEKHTRPRTDGRNGLRVLSILHDAQRSLDASGQIVQRNLNEAKEVAHATS